MSSYFEQGWHESLLLTDPSLVVPTADGRLIPSAEYYDEALAGWTSDPYTQLADLEDAKAGRGYAPGKRRPAPSVPARDQELFIRRPVVPSDELVDVLQTVAPFHNPSRGTRCHKPGTDRDNGLHSTILNTRGMTNIELPSDETFDPTHRVPTMAMSLGKLSLSGVELFRGSVNYHVVLLFGHKAIAKLREERDVLEREHFPALSIQQGKNTRVFRPHVTLVSTRDAEIARQALQAIQDRTQPLKKIDLAPARHTFYQTQYADTLVTSS